MRISDISKVKPAKDNVVIRSLELEREDGLFFAKSNDRDLKNSPLSFGEVLAIGPEALNEIHCPDLRLGDKVVFNQFTGSHVATEKPNELYKIMGGYSIMATLDDINNLEPETVHPASNRLLLAVKFLDETDDGLYISADESKNPQLEDLAYGVIIKTGPSCKLGYKVGDIVGYQPYAGENIRPALSADKPALRVLIEEDVLLTI